MLDTSVQVYDLLNPAVLRNPHPTLAHMRMNASPRVSGDVQALKKLILTIWWLWRLLQLQLDIDVEEIEWNETVLLHSMKSMPVRF